MKSLIGVVLVHRASLRIHSALITKRLMLNCQTLANVGVMTNSPELTKPIVVALKSNKIRIKTMTKIDSDLKVLTPTEA